MIVLFREYVHDEWEEGLPNTLVESLSHIGYTGDLEELAQKIGRPFYEVTLNCELDTETGEVKIVSTAL